jgi:hypothetical protein
MESTKYRLTNMCLSFDVDVGSNQIGCQFLFLAKSEPVHTTIFCINVLYKEECWPERMVCR